MSPSRSSRPPAAPFADWGDMPVLLDSRTACAVLGVSDNTLRALSRSGVLRGVAVHLGRQVRYPKDRLRSALEGGDRPADLPGI